MELLVSYDVSTETKAGQRRLRKVATICQSYGQRVQKSVFECSLTERQHTILIDQLLRTIDKDADSLRVYRLGEPRDQHVKAYGIDHRYDPRGPLIV
jgi:CRISPR-associated protein Cas2